MAHVMDATSSVLRPETAVEHRQMLCLEMRRILNCAGCIDVRNDLFSLFGGIAELNQSLRNGVVDNLDHATTYQFLILDQSQVWFNPGSVAIHHETDRSRRRQY